MMSLFNSSLNCKAIGSDCNMSDFFDGSDFEMWILHFRIGADLKQQLDNVGVRMVDDLADVYPDASLLEEVRQNVSPLDFKKFLRACKLTRVLKKVSLPSKYTALLSTNIPQTPPNLSSLSLADPEKDAQRRLVEVQAELDTLLATQSEDAVVLTETKIQAIQEQINKIQSGGPSAQKVATAHSEKAKRENMLQSRLEETVRRKHLIDALHETLRVTASLDVVFALDTTGSMTSFINAARDNMRELVDGLARLYPDIPLRVAFVGYKDHCNGEKRLSVLRFTDSIVEFKTALTAQTAGGGCGDFADVLGALKVAEAMDWRSTTRILYHIGDTPCHGVPEFHDNRSDPYAGGDPLGIKADQLLESFKRQRVQYYFGKVTNLTDKMIARFNAIMKGSEPFVITTPINANNMMSVVFSSVSSSMTSTLSTSARTDGGSVKVNDVQLVPGIPYFGTVRAELAHRYRLVTANTLAELINAETDECLEKFPESTLANVKIASHPFAKGAMKAAYHGIDCLTRMPIILKESMAVSSSQRTFAKYETFLACHAAASYLASEFNAIKPPGCDQVMFVETSVVHLRSRKDQPYFIQEAPLVGKFEKFNNNVGFCLPSPTSGGVRHEAVQAFSHWTHHVTGGALMVVDCQGVYCAATRTFKLTDPAIHATSLTRFGGTNIGQDGFNRFYKTHVCNAHCLALKLLPVKSQGR